MTKEQILNEIKELESIKELVKKNPSTLSVCENRIKELKEKLKKDTNGIIDEIINNIRSNVNGMSALQLDKIEDVLKESIE